MKPEITIPYLRECLDCEFESGTFRWKVRPESHFKTKKGWKVFNSTYAGRIAGSLGKRGYWVIEVDGQPIRSHRLIFAMANARWPENLTDHINGNRSDNRLSNLREVTAAENTKNTKRYKNNTTGMQGVYFHPLTGKWNVQIYNSGRAHYVGRFPNIEQAIAARKKAEQDFGYHPNHGRLAAA